MAKTVKKAETKAKSAKKKSSPKKKVATKKSNASTEELLEKTVLQSLAKLESMNIEHQLQADIRWCIGSYRYDKNPVGLIEMAGKSLSIFEASRKKNTKSVPAKLIADLKKATGK